MAGPTPLRQPMTRRLDRYEVVAEIARGGMGTVLLARLAGVGGFQRLFAIKLLHEHLSADNELKEALLDEARIAALIHHPNVVSIQEVCESEDHGYYLVMDYIEGFSLWDITQRMDLAPPARWRITNRVILDALNGLEAAHALVDEAGQPLNVVHRDVSPQNILVGVDGIARVTDFGIAKATARITSTRAGQVKGKLAYMAPEQAKGKHLDRRTDIFAVGIVLWETLTGQRLFRAASDAETFHRIVSGIVPRARERVPSIPAELDAVCARALEKEASHRYASAREMAQALETAARAHDLLGDAHEVGAWVRRAFEPELAARKAALREATSPRAPQSGERVSYLPGGLWAPQLGEGVPKVPAPEPPSVISGVKSVDDWDDVADTSVVGNEPGNADEDEEGPTRAMSRQSAVPELRAALALLRGVPAQRTDSTTTGTSEPSAESNAQTAGAARRPSTPGIAIAQETMVAATQTTSGPSARVASAAEGTNKPTAQGGAAIVGPQASTAPHNALSASAAASALASVTPGPVAAPSVVSAPTHEAKSSQRWMLAVLVSVGLCASGAALTIGLLRARTTSAQATAQPVRRSSPESATQATIPTTTLPANGGNTPEGIAEQVPGRAADTTNRDEGSDASANTTPTASANTDASTQSSHGALEEQSTVPSPSLRAAVDASSTRAARRTVSASDAGTGRRRPPPPTGTIFEEPP